MYFTPHHHISSLSLFPADGTPRRPSITLSPPYVQAAEFERADVQCVADGTPPIHYTWERLHGNLSHDVSVHDGLLRFRELRVPHQGEYRCTARNQFGDDTQLLRVYVTEQPRPATHEPPRDPWQTNNAVEIIPSTVSGRPGDELRLLCRSTAPGASVVWSRPGYEAQLPANAYVARDTLVIRQAQRHDAGQYTCTASVPGQRPATGHAYVYIADDDVEEEEVERPEEREHELQLQDLEQSYTVVQGHDLSVPCVVLAGGSGAPIVWSKVHEEFERNVQTTHDGVLRIVQALVANRGVYLCRVNNAQVSTVIEVERKWKKESGVVLNLVNTYISVYFSFAPKLT